MQHEGIGTDRQGALLRGALLRAGAELGWPYIPITRGVVLLAGEDAWRRFAIMATPTRLQEATTAAQAHAAHRADRGATKSVSGQPGRTHRTPVGVPRPVRS